MMDYDKSGTNRKNDDTFTLFPTPYPGESLYSILCRYHVRSGNSTDRHTVLQLFGCAGTLENTLLSPWHLDSVYMRIPETSGITVHELLYGSTAFPLYAISAKDPELSCIRNAVAGKGAKTEHLRLIQSKVIHPSGFLRYCPECFSEQEKVYGEPYWQVAPQLDGVEYCPIHRIRIRNSNISLKGIRHHFYPASLSVSPLPCTSEYHDLFSEERELFIKIACSINQILISGPAYEGLEKLQLAYSNAVGGSDNYHWFSFNEMIWHSFSRYPTKDALYDYLLDKTSETCFETTQSFSKVAPCIHVLLMTVFSGDPQAFYS